MSRRERIIAALDLLIQRERGKDFEYLSFQVARGWWPQLIETAYRNDRGEDAISLSGIDPSERCRSVACSLTATLAKVKGDYRYRVSPSHLLVTRAACSVAGSAYQRDKIIRTRHHRLTLL